MSTMKRVVLIFISILSLFFITPGNVHATLLYEDSFDYPNNSSIESNNSNWVPIEPGQATVQNGQLVFGSQSNYYFNNNMQATDQCVSFDLCSEDLDFLL